MFDHWTWRESAVHIREENVATKGVGFRSEHRSNDSCETTDVLGPVPEPIAGSVLSPLSALRCLVRNSRMLSGIPKLVGRAQEHFACCYFARILRRLVGVAQDIEGPPAIGHSRVPYAFAISAGRVVAHTNDFRCFRVATAIS